VQNVFDRKEVAAKHSEAGFDANIYCYLQHSDWKPI